MKKNIKLKLILSILFVFCLICSAISFIAMADLRYDDVSVGNFISKIYVEGDKVDFPDKYNGGNKMDRIVYAPSGQGYVSGSMQLNESGNWVIEYRNDSTIERYDFLVNKPMYVVSGSKSYVGIGKANDFTPYKAKNKSGVFAKIYNGEKITYNKIIDLNDKTKNDSIITFSILPDVVGEPDAKRFIFIFSDVNDSSNYLMLMVKYYDGGLVYVMAGSAEQDGIGLDENLYELGIVDGAHHIGFYATPFGSLVKFNILGQITHTLPQTFNNVGFEDLCFSMDYAEKKIYANGNIIADLDDPVLQDILWGGFSEGKCYMTFYADNYNSVAFNVLFTEIDGNEDLAEKYITNTVEPEIRLFNPDPVLVDYLIVGKSFKIPDAEGIDSFGNKLQVNVSAYRSYGSGTQTDILLKDGYFTPEQERIYYVVYSCVDSFGNSAEKVLRLEAIKNVTNEISAEIPSYVENLEIGDSVDVPLPIISNSVGGYSVFVSAELNGRSETLIKYDYNEQVDSCVFTPDETGTWKIKYVFSDLYFTKECSYDLEVFGSNKVRFDDEPVLPEFIIRNAEYVVPELFGYDFSAGKSVLKKSNVYIGNDSDITDAHLLSDDTFIITENIDLVKFFFEINGSVKTYEVPVLDIGYGTDNLELVKYFFGYDGEPELSNIFGCTYKFAKNNGKYKLSFVKELQSSEFVFGFSFLEHSTLDNVTINLTDSRDRNNVLSLKIFMFDDKVCASLNGGTALQLKQNKYESIVLRYHSQTNIISFSTNQTLNVTTNLDGKQWKGFTNDKVWLNLTTESTNDNKLISIERVNNQMFYAYSKIKSIDDSPEVFQIDISGEKELGSIISVPKLNYADVLAFNCRVTLKVKGPNGNYMKDTNGVILDGSQAFVDLFDIELSEYGKYIFSYVVKDELGGKNDDFIYEISIIDRKPPEIKIGEHKDEVKIGSDIIVADITIIDDESNADDCSVSVYIEKPDMTVFVWNYKDKTSETTFNNKGLYKIWYFVTDEENNATMKYYTVLVS